MKNTIVLILFFVMMAPVKSQVTDDFKDANFTVNPAWSGDDSLFQVNANLQLQSKGTVGSSKDISLVTPSVQNKGGEWSCWLRFALNPSTQNFCRFYLMSDQANLKGNLNGMYVQLGGSTGNTDSISLYKQVGSNRNRLIAGRAGTVSKTNNVVQLKVICDALGNWELLTDTSAQGNFISEGKAFDNAFLNSSYCGFFVRYTAGNVWGYYLDDVYVGPQRFDTIAPFVTSFTVTSANKILIGFSEKLMDASLYNKTNFEVDQGIFPTAIVGSQPANSIELQFSDSFLQGSLHQLKIKDLSDLSSNTMLDTLINFTYFLPQLGDILITELMPDPDPVIALPNAEFIELYNNSAYAIQLKGWKIKDPSSYAILPDLLINPGAYLILCEKQYENQFKNFGNTLGLLSFSSLNNAGDVISLLNEVGLPMDEVAYDLSWYHQIAKQNGGWSLELLNPLQRCKKDANWQASKAALGGTPGKENSNWNKSIDSIAPVLLRVEPIDRNTIALIFDEAIDSLLTITQVQIQMMPAANILNITYQKPTELLVQLQDSMVHEQAYQLVVENVFDCSGNQKKCYANYVFMEQREPLQNQLLVNEIMYAPSNATAMPDAEYIELYNRSNFVINLKDYQLSDMHAVTVFPEILLYPDSFLIVCSNSNKVKFDKYGNTCGLSNFPTLSTDKTITLFSNNGFIIHQLHYNESWLNDKAKQQLCGWSIEMKDPANPCGLANNWQASMNSNGGTPGMRNSVFSRNKDLVQPKLLRAYPVDSNHVQCYFSEAIDSLSAGKMKGIYLLNEQYPIAYKYVNATINVLEFTFEKAFDSLTGITIKTDSISDCALNVIGTDNAVNFGMPHKADSGDIVINEVLFNPVLNGFDFVELYNRSSHYIDLNPFLLARFDAQMKPEQLNHLGGNGWLIAPQQYLAITENAANIGSTYLVPNPLALMECGLPDLNDDAGSVILMDSSSVIMDAMVYTDKMHFELLSNTEGVSLERIDPWRFSMDKSNWTSAGSNCGYATPTYKNSQFNPVQQNGTFSIEPEVFSPDGDGYKDVLNFTYQLGSNNQIGKIEIYNSSGILIKRVCSNYSLGSKGVISWNGINDLGELALNGIYIANFECFNLQGETLQFQKTFVLAVN